MEISETDQIKCPSCGTQVTKAISTRWTEPGFIVPIYSYEYDVVCPSCNKSFLYCGKTMIGAK